MFDSSLTYTGKIIDTHMHLWDLKNGYHWLDNNIVEFEQLIGNYDSLRHNFLPPDYLALAQDYNIVQAVHVQAFGFPDDPVGESKWLQKQFEKYGIPNAVVAFANLADCNVEQLLAQHAQYSCVRGIRMPLNYHEEAYRCMSDRGDYLRDAQWLEGFALLRKYNFSFDVQIYDHQIVDVIKLAHQFPDTPLIIEHFAWPTDLSPSGFALWRERIASLVECPNVSMKLSGIGVVFKNSSAEHITRYIHTAVEVLGADRCMFGSNCPPDTLFYSFSDLLAFYKKALMNFSMTEQHQLFYANAQRIYRHCHHLLKEGLSL